MINNSNFFIGISLGLLLSMVIHFIMPSEEMDVATIEKEAKKLGMNYPSEFKVSSSITPNKEEKEDVEEME